MKKVDSNEQEIKDLRKELDDLFFTDADIDVDKISEVGKKLDELDPPIIDNETIERNKQELLSVVDRQLELEASDLLMKRAEAIRKTKFAYKFSRAAAVFVAVLFLTGITASAFGIDLFSLVAEFGDNLNRLKLIPNSTASQSPAPSTTESFAPPELVDVQYFTDVHEALQAMPAIPKYPSAIPDGITPIDISVSQPAQNRAQLDVTYADSEGNATIFITILYYDVIDKISRDFAFMQDYNVVERYYDMNIEYFVVRDQDSNQYVYWVEGHHIYTVFAKIDLDELKTIVNSFK